MRAGTFAMLVAAIVCLTLGGFTESPALLAVGAVLGRWAWVRLDTEQLLEMFG